MCNRITVKTHADICIEVGTKKWQPFASFTLEKSKLREGIIMSAFANILVLRSKGYAAFWTVSALT